MARRTRNDRRDARQRDGGRVAARRGGVGGLIALPTADAGWLSGALWALPWWLALLVALWRWRGSPSLDDESARPPADAPLLSVIIPARNESRHIAGALGAIRGSTYPRLEVIVVDDHSVDDTGALARRVAEGDARVQVIEPPPLPEGWLGKQWACEHGASAATGDILLFTDADVRHGPELHARLVNFMQRSGADLASIAGHQEAITFWERVVQPFVFSVLAQAYGGAGAVNRSRRASGKIANGQCLAFRRSAYDAFGRHAAVRARAAEDLAFAQGMHAAGYRTLLALGTAHMSTRMYESLGELIGGWGKNVYAAGREVLPGGRARSALAALLLPMPALWALAPVTALLFAAAGVIGASWLAFGAVATSALLIWFAAIARQFRIPLPYALLFPLGAAVYLYIVAGAIARGRRIAWKGRQYEVGSG